MLAYFVSLISYNFLIESKEFFLSMHTTCTKLFLDTLNIETNQALICGKPLPFGDSRSLFTRAGLIHLLVVSGYHLTLFQKALDVTLRALPFKKNVILIFLTFFCMITNWQAPAVRALFEWLLRSKLREHQAILGSWMLCLIWQPSWATSFSLQLSIIARSSIFLTKNRSLFFTTGGITLSLFPLIAFHHPFISFYTLLMGPFLMASLLFNSLCEFITHYFDMEWLLQIEMWNQKFIEFCYLVLQKLTTLFPELKKQTLIQSPYHKWAYVALHLMVVHLVGMHYHQNQVLKPVTRSQPRYLIWALILFSILALQPQTLGLKP